MRREGLRKAADAWHVQPLRPALTCHSHCCSALRCSFTRAAIRPSRGSFAVTILLFAQSVQFIAGELLRAQALEAADDGVFF